MKISKYSLIIIGTGISGLYAALKVSENANINENILLVTKASIGESNSRYAQGGIVAVLPDNKKDSVELHVKDTIRAGVGLTSFDVASEVSRESAKIINDLIAYGVEFDKDTNDRYSMTLEGAHSAKRVLHAGGDATGREIEMALVRKVKQNPKITVMENTYAVEIIKDSENRARGVVLLNDGDYSIACSSSIVLATGGLGQIFEYTTNPTVATADGLGIALEAGAVLQNMEFIQFHPTAISMKENGTCFLISEAVRGEGAKLRNQNGEFFAHKYDERGDLASRDIVTRAIYSETGGNPSCNVFLDTSSIDFDKFKKRFPNITNACEKKGINLPEDYIPITPAAHYCMGGIQTKLNGVSSIEGLYAVGETACTSLHGANRLASNSLLECSVGAYKLAQHLSKKDLSTKDIPLGDTIKKYSQHSISDKIDVNKAKSQLKAIMWQKVGILRNEKLLKEALAEVLELKKLFKSDVLNGIQEYELRNMVLAAQTIIISALNRKESRGGHYRSDYPESKNQAEHSYLTKEEISNYVEIFTA